MTSHAVLMFALAAMLVNVTSADLEKRSITDDSGASGQWPVTGGQLQKWLLDSLTKKEELILKNVEIINAKEKELWELRSKVKQLETMCDVTGGAMTSQGGLKDGITSQGREMTKLRCEQTEREIRGLQADHEALTNRSLQLQSENLKIKFDNNELNQNNQLLKQSIESYKEQLNQCKEINSSEYFQPSRQQNFQQNELKIGILELRALMTLVQDLSNKSLQDKLQPCTNKIAELKMVKLGNHYYYFSYQLYQKTWHEAYTFCKSHGLDLVSIESEEENILITAHLVQINGSGCNQHYWLGGNDLSTKGRWVWSSTGQLLTFTSWIPGEPNSGPTYNCMLTHFEAHFHRLWNDFPCSNKLPFICEMKETCN